MDVDEINEFLEEMHELSKKDKMPVWPDDEDDYIELVNEIERVMKAMPKYKNRGAREEVEEFPSLLGAFGKLFLRLEDAYLDLAEMGADGKMDPEEIIRIHAFDIGMAVFKYVSKAMVHASVTTTTAGICTPIVTGTPTAPVVGAGVGIGAGKLS